MENDLVEGEGDPTKDSELFCKTSIHGEESGFSCSIYYTKRLLKAVDASRLLFFRSYAMGEIQSKKGSLINVSSKKRNC